MTEREYELATLINKYQYEIAKLKELLAQPESLREDLREDLREGLREGISLRDHFACAAMQGFLAADYNDWDYEKLALTSYEQADAMLNERSK
jgi:hypothetical protein